MLADHRDGLSSSSFSLILDSSVGLSASIQSAGELVHGSRVQILLSAEEHNLSPFDLNIACLCESIEINNKHASCMYVCMYVYMCVCVYACMHACMHACMYVSLKAVSQTMNWISEILVAQRLKHLHVIECSWVRVSLGVFCFQCQ